MRAGVALYSNQHNITLSAKSEDGHIYLQVKSSYLKQKNSVVSKLSNLKVINIHLFYILMLYSASAVQLSAEGLYTAVEYFVVKM